MERKSTRGISQRSPKLPDQDSPQPHDRARGDTENPASGERLSGRGGGRNISLINDRDRSKTNEQHVIP
jgi:hypothetical protein